MDPRPTFLISAGEASGDMYAAALVAALRQNAFPSAQFFGCAGPKLQAQGVSPIIDAASLSVVGLAEVVAHLPRIYGQYRKLLRYTRAHPPTAAILTDNPDFHLRLARHLKKMGVPVFYLVAPRSGLGVKVASKPSAVSSINSSASSPLKNPGSAATVWTLPI